MFHGLTNDFLYSAYKVDVVFRDDIGNQKSGHGTGFFVLSDNGIINFVTNRHILDIAYRSPSGKDFSKYKLTDVSISGKAKDPETGLPTQAEGGTCWERRRCCHAVLPTSRSSRAAAAR